MKTEAAILVELGRPLETVALGIPALKPGQALVEIAYSGVCGTQLMEWRGDKGEDKWLPHCLGHEATGTVVDTGAAVTKAKAGDKVVLSWLKGSGIEAGGSVYDWDGRKVNAGSVTNLFQMSLAAGVFAGNGNVLVDNSASDLEPNGTWKLAPVPLPAGLLLFSSGLGLFGGSLRRSSI